MLKIATTLILLAATVPFGAPAEPSPYTFGAACTSASCTGSCSLHPADTEDACNELGLPTVCCTNTNVGENSLNTPAGENQVCLTKDQCSNGLECVVHAPYVQLAYRGCGACVSGTIPQNLIQPNEKCVIAAPSGETCTCTIDGTTVEITGSSFHTMSAGGDTSGAVLSNSAHLSAAIISSASLLYYALA